MADVVLNKKEELAITRCLLLGAQHQYDDYGHPERASARKYHTYRGLGRFTYNVGYGSTQGRAAMHWLVISGYASQFRVAQKDSQQRAD